VDAEAAFRRVAMLTAAGDLAGARSVLRNLGDRADAAGRAVLASRALRLSATLDRALGDTDDAVATARRAVERAEGTGDAELVTAAWAELGESSVAAGRAADGAAAYGKAAATAGSTEQATALRRMQALALTSAGLDSEAAAVFGDPTDEPPRLDHAARLLRDAREAVGATEPAPDTDLAFLAAARALDERDLPRALAEIRSARRHALDGGAVLPYIAAAVAESAVAELIGDDVAAYGSLATGYATVGDVVGKRLSASTFEGPLVRLRERWGRDRFDRAKRAYEDGRRRARVT
jgi:hypothetical protein